MRLLLMAAVLLAPAAAQNAISARSAVISYVEGRVFLNGKLVPASPARWPEVPKDAVLRSRLGLAEVMLNPCTVLHLGENSSLRMLTGGVVDSRLELLAGSAEVQDDAEDKDTSVRVTVGNTAVRLGRDGIYRFDAMPPRLRVYEGAALLPNGGKVSKGHMLVLNSGRVTKLPKIDPDSLDLWSRQRVRLLARENGLAARQRRRRRAESAAPPPPLRDGQPDPEGGHYSRPLGSAPSPFALNSARPHVCMP